MKKYFHLLLVSILLAIYVSPNSFAAGLIVDYAHNVDAIEGKDSLNYLVTPTSDGGYLVGTCMLDSGSYSPNDWGDKSDSCDFYLSKYRVDGGREWLSVVNAASMMISVGEMANDYRIMTENGVMMAFEKDDGEYISSTSINRTSLWGAGFYMDDTLVAYGDGDFFRYDKDGNQIGAFAHGYGDHGYCNFGLATFSNGDFAFACGEAADGLVRVSPDLAHSEYLFDLNGSAWIAAIDEDKYVLSSVGVCEVDGSCRCTHTSYNMTGEMLASMQLNQSATDVSVGFVGGYYFVNNLEHTIKKMSPKFDPIFEYTFDENETFYSVAPLKDRSVVGVGLSSAATATYSINSDANGIYYRWIDEDVSVLSDADNGGVGESVNNPDTADAVMKNCAALVILVGFFLVTVSHRRR